MTYVVVAVLGKGGGGGSAGGIVASLLTVGCPMLSTGVSCVPILVVDDMGILWDALE